MRILHVFHRYLDSSSNWIYHLIKPLLSQIYVEIAAPIYIHPEFKSKTAEYVKIPYQINYIQASGFFYHYKIKRNIKAIRKYIKNSKKRLDLVHAHFSFTGWEYLQACLDAKVPLIVSFYGYDYENLPFHQPVWYSRYEELFSGATSIFVEGPHGAAVLKELGCPMEKIHVVPLGVEMKEESEPKKKRHEPLRLLQVANLKEKKGHIYTLQAFKQALDAGHQLELTLVGEGDPQIGQALMEYIETHKLRDKIQIIPFVKFDELNKVLTDHDVLIQPSLYTEDRDTEGGAPVILLDAQAVGMPVISTRHADIPHVVVDGETGLLSEERDIEALSENVIRFVTMSDSEYQKFSNHAREWVKNHFNSEQCATHMLGVYQQILGKIKTPIEDIF